MRPLERMADKAGNYAYRLGQGEAYVDALVRQLDRAYEGRDVPPEVTRTINAASAWLKGGE